MLPLLLLPLTMGNDPEPFRVQNHVPPSFQVTNKVPPAKAVPPVVVLPTDPNEDAPPGYQWQRRQGEDWKLVKVAAAPVVAAPRPFASAGTTPTTPVIGAAVPSTSSSGFYPAASTFTLAPGAGIPGVTNCAPGGA